MDAAIQNAMTMAQQKPLPVAPKPTSSVAQADKAAKDYETVFVSQFLSSMFSGIATDGITGGAKTCACGIRARVC